MSSSADSGKTVVNWFSANIDALLLSMVNGVINLLINPIIAAIGTAFTWACGFLPDFSIGSLDISAVFDSQFLAYLNWFVPFDALTPCFVTIFTAISVYYLVFPLLRWFKLVK